MKKYHGVVISSATGEAIREPTITVYFAGTTNLATIYSDEGVTVKANPFVGDAVGRFDFYAPDGDYRIKVEKAGITSYILEDVTIQDEKRVTSVDVRGREAAVLANAFYDRDVAQWQRRDTTRRSWRAHVSALSDEFVIEFAPSGANPIAAWTPVARVTAGGLELFAGQNYLYAGLPALRAQAALENWYVGGAGNLTGTGQWNTAFGWGALQANTTGSFNVAVGWGALRANTTGSFNTAVGEYALGFNTTGRSNTAVGEYALWANTEGIWNTAVGESALGLNTTGNSNTAVGLSALLNNTTGSFNTAVGLNALQANTTGDSNTAVGINALLANTTGGQNVAVGADALYANTTGGQNVAVGASALYANTGYGHVAVGWGALYANTTGFLNTALGLSAGNLITTGSRNIIIGQGANPPTADTNDYLSIGVNRLIEGYLADASIAAGATGILIRRNVGGVYSTVQVTMGGVDSGGAGFRVLRVPN